jgi:hypothetical protein
MVALLMFGATDRGEHRQAAGAIAEAVTLGPTRPGDDIPAQVVERHAEAHINSGATPALGSYEGGGYERQDEGR